MRKRLVCEKPLIPTIPFASMFRCKVFMGSIPGMWG